jgi:hypothetical protein
MTSVPARSLETRAFALACVAGILGGAGDAHAFCRTRTVGTAADYDATMNGCSDKGVPLFWRNACVGYSLYRQPSTKIGYDEAANLISQAFTRWTGATCPSDPNGQSRASIDVRDLGPVDCKNIEYVSGVANQNVIVFRDDHWPYPPRVLGLTTVKFNPTTGEIYGADMEINTLGMDPLVFRDPVRPGDYDFLSIVTHEAGHFLGMAHSDVEHTTMYASYSHETGETFQRYLSPDDILGICTIYRPDGERSVLNEKVYPAPGCDPTPRGGFSTTCQEKPGFRCDSAASPARPSYGVFWGIVLAGGVFGWRAARRLRRGLGSGVRRPRSRCDLHAD